MCFENEDLGFGEESFHEVSRFIVPHVALEPISVVVVLDCCQVKFPIIRFFPFFAAKAVVDVYHGVVKMCGIFSNIVEIVSRVRIVFAL